MNWEKEIYDFNLDNINCLKKNELSGLIRYYFEKANEKELNRLFHDAVQKKERIYGKDIYFRGLLEFTTFCNKECYYCGLCKNNKNAVRYRLTEKEIMESCKIAYQSGLRTFVLQGGEDAYFSDDKMLNLVKKIKCLYPGVAITLSLGERSAASYLKLFQAGAERFLLRHETASEEHYKKLHPKSQTLLNRKKCLYELKSIGYQTGAGFMVDSPYQTEETLADDLLFLKELNPEMVGIGPFIPQKETIFRDFDAPVLKHTLVMLALVRNVLPSALIPATTALGTISEDGRELGFRAGANVLMPNISPMLHRNDYKIYEKKICKGLEGVEHLKELACYIESLGLTPNFSRGDYLEGV